MSKRAEDYANKRFPPDMGGEYRPIRGGYEIIESDFNSDRRFGCKIGYEQAEKDTIERAVAWLKENANKYIVDIGVGYGENGRNVELIVGGMCWDDLKKAMEEEK